MKKLQHLFVLGLLAMLPVFSTALLAQDGDVEYRYFNDVYNTYNDYKLSQLNATTEQLLAIATAKRDYFELTDKLENDFLFHEDKKALESQYSAAFEAKVKAILTEQQFEKLKKGDFEEDEPDEAFDPADWDKATYIATATDFFLEEYEFLDITQEQATNLAEKQADILALKQWDDYEEKMYKVYEETFTETQLIAYNKYQMEQIQAAEAVALAEYEAEEAEAIELGLEAIDSTEAVEAEQVRIEQAEMEKRIAEASAKHEESMKMLVEFMHLAHEILKDYFVPERANIRAKIEVQLSPADREILHRLREQYDLYATNLMSMKAVQLDNPLDYLGSRSEVFEQLNEIEAEMEKLEAKELMGLKGADRFNQELESFLQSERGIFYAAKDLATRYDKLLDGYAKENDLLIISCVTQLIPSFPEGEHAPQNEEEVRKKLLKAQYQTEEVEYRRNILFLLSKPGEYDPAALQSNRMLHEVSVFPVPASEQQTISFSTANDGMATVEVVLQDGKLLKTVQTGVMQKGSHQLSVDVRDIPTKAYFYRITTVEGTSLVKGMKAE